MSFPSYPSPLIGYENAPPLPAAPNDGRLPLVNLPVEEGKRSKTYEEFPDPITNETNGFDFHGQSCLYGRAQRQTKYLPPQSLLHAEQGFRASIRQRVAREDKKGVSRGLVAPCLSVICCGLLSLTSSSVSINYGTYPLGPIRLRCYRLIRSTLIKLGRSSPSWLPTGDLVRQCLPRMAPSETSD